MESAKDQLSLLKQRIAYDKDIFESEAIYENVLTNLLSDSKFIALSLRFPFEDYSNIELPSKYNNWQLRCCVEIYTNLGKGDLKSYSENGILWTRDPGNISSSLRNEIMPKVGVIKGEEIVNDSQ